MNQVKIGWAKRELSIAEPVSIPGQMYLRISEGIHDPLYATALCVDGGEGQDCVIFCSCDVVVLRGGVIPETLEKVAAMRPEIPTDSIVMCATHTHAGGGATNTPELSPDGTPIYSGAKYRDFFTTQCAEAICEAWDKRAEGGVGYGYGYAVVAHSRRVVYHRDQSLINVNAVAPNGHGVMYGNTAKDDFSHYEAGADHFLNLMFTFDTAQKLTGIVVNVPCPSQLSEHFRKLSADYWNEVRQLVAKEYGEDVFVLPQCAAAGDLSPRTLHYKDAQARRMQLKYGLSYDHTKVAEHGVDEYNKVMAERYDIAERIMNGIRDVYSWAKKDIQTKIPVRHARKDIQIARRLVTDEERQECIDNIEKMRLAIPDPATCTKEEYRVAKSRYDSIKNRNERAVVRYEEQKEDKTFDTAIFVTQIGEIAFATNRFEYFMDFMHRIQARSPFIQTFVIQLAGVEGGSYLATERGAANKGYSASLFCNQVSAEGGQQIVEHTLDVLNGMAQQNG